MAITVPSLTSQTYLTDPQSIIGYQLRRYGRQPKDTVTILPDLIISLPWQIANFGKDPDTLVSNIQSDLQGVFTRIFRNERKVTVNVSHSKIDSGTYSVSVSVIYTLLSGELQQTGTTLALKNGQLTIPEDQINWMSSPYNLG